MNSAALVDLLGTVLTVAAVVLLVPCCVLLVQVLAAVLPTRVDDLQTRPTASRAHVAVLVPAHDEAAGIGATLRAIQAQLAPGDRVLVVADNCSDDTAALARSADAEVVGSASIRCAAARAMRSIAASAISRQRRRPWSS